MSQKEFAQAIGVTLSSLKNYESGRRWIPADIVRRIVDQYGISADYLLGITDVPYTDVPKGDILFDMIYRLEPTRVKSVREFVAYEYQQQLKAEEESK